MLVRGLDDKEIDNYFSDMMTEKEMRPYIDGRKAAGLPPVVWMSAKSPEIDPT